MKRTIISPKSLLAFAALACAAVTSAALSGCGYGQAQSPPPPNMTPVVEVAVPITQVVTDFEEFTGRTDAVESVNVVARATGYLAAVHFHEGAIVKKGQLLFDIDAKPYQALFDQAQGQVDLMKAQVKQAVSDNDRAKELSKTEGAISRQDIDKYLHTMEQMQAALKAAKATLETARINLGYCQVTSPIDGRISRFFITPGNMVTQDQTLLTNVVSLDPIYAYFDIDERTYAQIQQLKREGKMVSMHDKPPVSIGLASEEGFPHSGYIDFFDNRVDSGTGTMRARGLFANHDYILTPGLFARVQLPVSEPHQAILVPEKALLTDQGRRYLYVVSPQPVLDSKGNPERGLDGKTKMQEVAGYRQVTLGPLQGEMRVINKGLKAGERVVVSGLQRIMKDGTPVNPKLVPAIEEKAEGKVAGKKDAEKKDAAEKEPAKKDTTKDETKQSDQKPEKAMAPAKPAK
ncbi:MAG: efflux RND transporter periplasmic adaptor subunit [Planctomycetia bacterium]|nr:efflux RND transporter periplasmic adaptor subunit [Planctomycetia bacterium]